MSSKILKAKSKQSDMQFIGVYVPQWMYVFLNKYMLAKECNKSDLLRTILDGWITQQGSEINNELNTLLIDKAKKKWSVAKKLTKDPQLFLFKRKLEKELQDNHISPDDIITILNELK